MKKLIVSMFTLAFMVSPAFAAKWNAVDRVSTVGKAIITKNALPAKTTFKVVNGTADNSGTSLTNVIQISSTDLTYAGNDSEVAAVIANEMGHIINGTYSKNQMRNAAKNAITSKLSSENIITTAANSEFLANKTNLSDEKAADITGVDLLAKTNYNPLAMIVVITKKPGSTLEALQGKPSNTERAMNVYDYMTYNYPSRVKAGYGCQEYRSFLAYATPIVTERNSNKKKLAKFNKEQAKNKALRAKDIAQFKTTGGISGWDASYTILKTLSESTEK